MVFSFTDLSKVDIEKVYAILYSDRKSVIGFIEGSHIYTRIKDRRYHKYYLTEIRPQDVQGIIENLNDIRFAKRDP